MVPLLIPPSKFKELVQGLKEFPIPVVVLFNLYQETRLEVAE